MKQHIKLKGRLRRYLQWPIVLGIVFAVLDAGMYFWDVHSAEILSGFLALYMIVVICSYYLNKPYLTEEIISFATHYGTVQRQLLKDFEIPYALLDYSGKILWMNDRFMELTGKEKSYHKSVTTIFPTLTRELIQNSDIQNLAINWEDRMFRATANKIYFDSFVQDSELLSVENSERFLTALYLFDETELNRYIRENNEQKLVAGLIYIDNYEEALESIEDVKRSLLIALVDRKVNKYFSEIDALVRKIEKDKYFIVFRQKYLEQLENDKFSVLEDVKTIHVGNEMAVTLSIGIGTTGATYTQSYEYAHAAIDLALGRGGDQVVIKAGEETTYYGGSAKQVEKNTRVKARVKAHALREMIETHERVIVMGHRISDVDALGASVGVLCAAKVLGKQAQIVVNDPTASLRTVMERFTEENGYDPNMFIDSARALEIADRNTLVMVVDTNRPSYTECPELLKKRCSVVVFDHHRQGSEVIENPILSYIEPYASSTCEMIAEVLQYFSEDIKLEPEEADAIYAGILIDTNNFTTKTGVRTFEAAAYLKRCGAEINRVRKMLRNDMESYKKRAEILQNAEVYRGCFAISVCNSEDVESPTIVGAQAANELLNITGIKASFVLTEFEGKIFVSSRSIDEINVQLIMERLGGGGHLSMAGAQLTDCTVEEGKKRLKDTLDGMLKEGDIEA